MGNIVVSEQSMGTWKREAKTVKNLLAMQPFNSQEQATIASARTEKTIKVFMAFLLSVSFSVSLRRYFPGTIFTENNFLFALSTISIVFPSTLMASIYTNQEIIAKLMPIKKNHEILDS